MYGKLRSLFLAMALAGAAQGAAAQGASVDCSVARDPERCQAHQEALAACADQRGRAKMACINERLPPVDCAKTANPARCEARERAKQVCQGKSGKELKACLGGAKPAKAGKKKTKKPVKKAPAT